MIKIYLDWNVMAQMKDGYRDDLLKILANRDRFFIPYSTSHIGDILSSFSDNEEQQKRIDRDLEFISSLTNNLCVLNNGKQISIDKSCPKELYKQRLDDKDFMKDFSLDTLGDMFSGNGLTKGIGENFISLLKSLPLDKAFKDAIENPESGKCLNQMFPELKENPTMEGFFKSFGKMYENLNNKEDYKYLREVTQKGLGINRDKIHNSENPYALIDSAHNKLGVDLSTYIDNTKNAPEWFNKISNEYIQLDMHGYQEDKVRVKEKKRIETFKNTTEDAFHSAFASTCSFYVINDNKSYKKTKQIFERLNINTQVLKPDEFTEYFEKYLNIESTVDYFNLAVEIIKTGEFYESKDENGIQRIYMFPYYLFDFFNKIVVVESNNDDSPVIMLSRFSPTNGSITHFMEVEILVKTLNKYFGVDVNNKGEFSADEFQEGNWDGRIWKSADIEFRLIAMNGFVQLYFDL